MGRAFLHAGASACAWALSALGTPTLAGHGISKASVERGGHVLVLDHGARPGVVDPGDGVVDLEAPCGRAEPRAVVLKRPAGTTPDLTAPLARLGGFKFDSAVIDGFAGEHGKPIIIIYPETHLEQVPTPGNRRLHARVSDELVRLTEVLLRDHRHVLNAIENLEIGWRATRVPEAPDANARRAIARELAWRARRPVAGGDAIAVLYPGVPTALVDDPDLSAREAAAEVAGEIASGGSFNPRRNYSRRFNRFLRRNYWAFADRPDLIAYFDALVRRGYDEIEETENQLCEARSVSMADRVADRATDVGYLKVGADHLHGVRARLRERGVGYLILSP